MNVVTFDNLIYNVNEAIKCEAAARAAYAAARAAFDPNNHTLEAAETLRVTHIDMRCKVGEMEDLGFELRDELGKFLSARGAGKLDGERLHLPTDEVNLVEGAIGAILRASPRITARGIPPCRVGKFSINVWDGEFSST